MPDLHAVRGRPTGRGRPQGPLVHAVPGNDRTRSALCGARVGGQPRPWSQPRGTSPMTASTQHLRGDPGTCPECAALVQPGTA